MAYPKPHFPPVIRRGRPAGHECLQRHCSWSQLAARWPETLGSEGSHRGGCGNIYICHSGVFKRAAARGNV